MFVPNFAASVCVSASRADALTSRMTDLFFVNQAQPDLIIVPIAEWVTLVATQITILFVNLYFEDNE